jgi:putative protease
MPEGFPGDRVYLIQTKTMSKRYAPVIGRNAGGRGPGGEKAPIPAIMMKRQEKGEPFPEGLYVAVSRLEDLFIAQSSRPERVMLALSPKIAKYLLADNKPPLPFKPAEIILTLDPWFPQGLSDYGAEKTAAEIAGLVEKGYLHYALNNLGQFSLFREFRDKVQLIAGPWLYTFNSWALSFVVSLGADAFVSPLENNRQNLERTLEAASRRSESKHGGKRRGAGFLHSKFFITVFAWPPLFNIRADLGAVLDFSSFTDSKEEAFTLAACPSGSRVYPDKHFSIVDKIPFLKEAGFGRFIIDLSGSVIKKSDYRNLLRSVKENAPLPHSSRFNWKDGFYQNQNTGSSSLAVAKIDPIFSASESE